MPAIRENGVNVTPLIDIVMCLIIFFMLVAKIGVDTGADRNIDIPTSILGTDIKDMGNTLVLNVVNGPTGVPDPQPIVTALVRGQMEELKLRDFFSGRVQDQLLNTLKLYRQGDPLLKMQPNPDFKVVIRGDRSLTFRFLAPVLMDCNLAHVRSFAFDTKQPQ
ncbi:MAG: biopolymer transporter ExbD [Tepidisphaeraceae bacterium]|jgi:biopolymer transport protein ExbD